MVIGAAVVVFCVVVMIAVVCLVVVSFTIVLFMGDVFVVFGAGGSTQHFIDGEGHVTSSKTS